MKNFKKVLIGAALLFGPSVALGSAPNPTPALTAEKLQALAATLEKINTLVTELLNKYAEAKQAKNQLDQLNGVYNDKVATQLSDLQTTISNISNASDIDNEIKSAASDALSALQTLTQQQQ